MRSQPLSPYYIFVYTIETYVRKWLCCSVPGFRSSLSQVLGDGEPMMVIMMILVLWGRMTRPALVSAYCMYVMDRAQMGWASCDASTTAALPLARCIDSPACEVAGM